MEKAIITVIVALGLCLFSFLATFQAESLNLKKKQSAHWWVNEDPNAINQVDYLCTKKCKEIGQICGSIMAKCCPKQAECLLQDDGWTHYHYCKNLDAPPSVIETPALTVNVDYRGRTFDCSD